MGGGGAADGSTLSLLPAPPSHDGSTWWAVGGGAAGSTRGCSRRYADVAGAPMKMYNLFDLKSYNSASWFPFGSAESM